MKIKRLQTIDEVLAAWPFVAEAISVSKEPIEPERLFSVITYLIARPTIGWVGSAEDSFGNRLAFGIAEECSKNFSAEKVFQVRFLYFKPGRHDATMALMRAFEGWARKNNVSRYEFHAERGSGAAVACFGKYRFRKHRVIFSKSL